MLIAHAGAVFSTGAKLAKKAGFEQNIRLKFLKKFHFHFDHIVNSKQLTTDMGFQGFPVNLFLDKDGIIRVMEGNIPYKKNEAGELEMSSGQAFLDILEKLR